MSVVATDELVEALAELRRLFPDCRMGQLVANLLLAAGAPEAEALWDVTDDRLLAAARRLIDRNRGRVEEDGVSPGAGSSVSQPSRPIR